jgi:hypothetical protein
MWSRPSHFPVNLSSILKWFVRQQRTGGERNKVSGKVFDANRFIEYCHEREMPDADRQFPLLIGNYY